MKTNDIQIIDYKPIPNSACLARFGIKIPFWNNFYIRDICLFSKNGHRWISFPARPYEKDGKKKYYSYNGFESREMMDQFQKTILQILDEYTSNNSVAIQQELPF